MKTAKGRATEIHTSLNTTTTMHDYNNMLTRVLNRFRLDRVANMVVRIAPFSFLLALNFFKPAMVSCRCTFGATRCLCCGDTTMEQHISLDVHTTVQCNLNQPHLVYPAPQLLSINSKTQVVCTTCI